MTEIPFALLMVVAIRLWWAKKPLLSCIVVAYLPLVRPEGFFFCALWALLILKNSVPISLSPLSPPLLLRDGDGVRVCFISSTRRRLIPLPL